MDVIRRRPVGFAARKRFRFGKPSRAQRPSTLGASITRKRFSPYLRVIYHTERNVEWTRGIARYGIVFSIFVSPIDERIVKSCLTLCFCRGCIGTGETGRIYRVREVRKYFEKRVKIPSANTPRAVSPVRRMNNPAGRIKIGTSAIVRRMCTKRRKTKRAKARDPRRGPRRRFPFRSILYGRRIFGSTRERVVRRFGLRSNVATASRSCGQPVVQMGRDRFARGRHPAV